MLMPTFTRSRHLTLFDGCLGELHGSSLILDEVKSNLNGLLVEAVKRKSFKHLNFVEVNNVCDKGFELLDALRANYV